MNTKLSHTDRNRFIDLEYSGNPKIVSLYEEIRAHPLISLISVRTLYCHLYPKPPKTHIRSLEKDDKKLDALYKIQDILDKISITITGEVT